MQNRTLAFVLGALGMAYIGALVAIFIWYDGDQVIAATLLSGAIGVLIPSLLSLKQSADNAMAIEKTIAKVDDNTETTDKTHLAVNSRMDVFMEKVTELAEVQKQLIAASELARGITIGREQMEAQPPHEP